MTKKFINKYIFLCLTKKLRIQTGKFQLKIQLLLKDKMQLNMKKLDFFFGGGGSLKNLGFTEKSDFLGRGHEKPIQREGLSKMGRLGQFANLRKGAWQERGGRRVDTPMHTMVARLNFYTHIYNFIFLQVKPSMLNVKLCSQRHIQNQVEHLQWHFFSQKIVNGLQP